MKMMEVAIYYSKEIHETKSFKLSQNYRISYLIENIIHLCALR